MKRNRAELTASKAPKTPAKTQRRYKDPTSKGTERTRAAAPEKPRKGDGAEKSSAAATTVNSFVPAASAPAPAPEVEQERPLGWDEFGGWWWWGAEEEVLLGWFPFVEEDFLCSENRGGSGLFWEEEDHDIWQLQHIQEIPNQAK
ncbi:uncharacterized protein [Elaeis guineensis]|uniref:Uncharacterized protein LOC105048443 n=1 Tax=Elaeis guineensis var. tenera TaxID=51953 RepID=A0A6I9RGU5_ELAGV|nr:uncharacterized protein LOC105048443 [Elaeis guineensis]